MPQGYKPNLVEKEPGERPSYMMGDGFIGAKDSNYKNNDWYQDGGQKQPGKWIIRFNNSDIDNAWSAVLQGIRKGFFYKAEFSRSDENNNQVIAIYTYDKDHVDDIIFVHDKIEKLRIRNGAISANIEYQANENTLYTSDQIEKIKSEKPNVIASFLLNVFTSEAFTAAALLIVALAIGATVIGATLMGAPVVAAAVAGTGIFLAFGTLAVVGFFCQRDGTKSLEEVDARITLS